VLNKGRKRSAIRGCAALAAASTLLAACHGSDSSSSDPTSAVLRQYAVTLDANYKDDVTLAQALKSAVDAFVAAPSADGLAACQKAWLAAHQVYGQGEYSRFFGGPIDQAQGAINEWPIDETFIDYTSQTPSGGIINDAAQYPNISPVVLATADEKGGIENLSTGFHAIEFLLWGERPQPDQGPGTRPYTDYADGGTAANQARRRLYLQTVTGMLVDDLVGLEAQWDLSDPKSYASQLLAGDAHVALTDFFRGLSQMAISELLYERLDNPYVSRDKKDEASCFSETTLADLEANALGVEDAYTGHYQPVAGASIDGPSISDLVKAKDPALDANIRAQLSTIKTAIGAIPGAFDHDVLAPDGSAQRQAVKAAVDALQPLQNLLDQAAKDLSIINNL
jgi:putative iron-regulated protein